MCVFFFSSRRRHTRCGRDWSSDVCSSDLHPHDPDNLLKSSGRGVLLIRSVMDETKYNDRGNRLSMIKRRASLLKEEPMDRSEERRVGKEWRARKWTYL